MEPELEEIEARLRGAYAELEPRPGFRAELRSRLRPRGWSAVNWAALGSVAAVVLAVAGIGVLVSRPQPGGGGAPSTSNLAPYRPAMGQGAAGSAAKFAAAVPFGALPYPPGTAPLPVRSGASADVVQAQEGVFAAPPRAAYPPLGAPPSGTVYGWVSPAPADFAAALRLRLPAGWSVAVQASTYDLSSAGSAAAGCPVADPSGPAVAFLRQQGLLPPAYRLLVLGRFVRVEEVLNGTPVVNEATDVGVECGVVTSASGPIPHAVTAAPYQLRESPAGAQLAFVQVDGSGFGYFEPVYVAGDGSVTPALLDRDLRRQ